MHTKNTFCLSVVRSAELFCFVFLSEKGRGDKSAAGRRAASADPPFYNNEVKNKKPMTRRGRAEPDLFFPDGFAKGPINCGPISERHI